MYLIIVFELFRKIFFNSILYGVIYLLPIIHGTISVENIALSKATLKKKKKRMLLCAVLLLIISSNIIITLSLDAYSKEKTDCKENQIFNEITNECKCKKGYSGPSCEPSCPGLNITTLEECNGHGECKSNQCICHQGYFLDKI